MKIGPTARLLSALAALFLGMTGGNEWSVKSQNASSWDREISWNALAIRAQGKLKVGLAIGFAALASAGVVTGKNEGS